MGRVTQKRISKIKGKDFCPICGKPMVEIEYVGTNPSVLAKLASGEEGDFAADLKEDGKDVWREVRRKRKEG